MTSELLTPRPHATTARPAGRPRHGPGVRHVAWPGSRSSRWPGWPPPGPRRAAVAPARLALRRRRPGWRLNFGPLAVICGGMLLAAFIDGYAFKVPNWCTLSLVVSGWYVGLLHDFGVDASRIPPARAGSGPPSAGTALGFALLVPGPGHRRDGPGGREDDDGFRVVGGGVLRRSASGRSVLCGRSPSGCSSAGCSAW